MLSVPKFTLADVVVFAVCELIAIPLCDASWHAIVTDGQTIRGVVGLVMGIPVGIAGFTFHWWKDGAKTWLLNLCKDWWPLAAVVLMAYVVNPSLTERLRLMLPGVGPIIWNVDDPHQAGFFIGMSQLAGQEIRVFGFQAVGRNTSSNAITDIKGYIKSLTTNKELPILLITSETPPNFPFPVPVPIQPNDTYGIPPYADFSVTTQKATLADTQKDAISTSQFLSDFSTFDFVFEYDGYRYKHRFTPDQVKMQFETFAKILSPDKSTTPRITRKEADQMKAQDAH
jgi:hypothetical protein